MKNLLNLLVFCICFACLSGRQGQVNAQNQLEALRYSQIFWKDNAFGALGGNHISGNINPASLALCDHSELHLSNLLTHIATEGSYLGELHQDYDYNFSIPGLGIILKTDGIETKHHAISFSFNRTNSFKARRFFQGINYENSITEFLAEDADGILPEDLSLRSYGGLAYGAYLIDPFLLDQSWYIPAIFYEDKIKLLQGQKAQTRGSINDIAFSIAYRKWSGRLLLGGTLGWSTLRYEEKSEFFEENLLDSVEYYQGMSLIERFVTEGDGAFMNLGFIIQPWDWIRIGASIRTPTFYIMHDDHEKEIFGRFKGYPSQEFHFSQGGFNYLLMTLLRSTFSVALLVKEYLTCAVDYELLNYSQANFSSNYYSNRYPYEKNELEINDKLVGNLRVGLEGKIEKLSLRVGFNYYGSPSSDVKAGRSTSIGLGIDLGIVDVDAAYVIQKLNRAYAPYTLSYETVEKAAERIITNAIMVTGTVSF